MLVDVRVMELLASKVCHDLVSPVSAINNGVELIEDIGGSVVAEAMKLIGDSGTKAARRLRLFRLAYGRAGSETNLGVKDARQVAEQYLAGTKISLIWPVELFASELSSSRGFLKLLLNLVVFGEEILPYGGVITLRETTKNEDGKSGGHVEIVGRGASLNDSVQKTLEGNVSVEELSPRTIQAYVTGRFAEQFGFKLSYDQSIPDRLDVTVDPSQVA